MKRSLLIFCFVGYLLTGCISNLIVWNAKTTIKKVALGTSKEQVIQIMGNGYLLSASSKDEVGNATEVFAYKSDAYEEYRLKFVNARLTEWNREFTNKYIVKDPSP